MGTSRLWALRRPRPMRRFRRHLQSLLRFNPGRPALRAGLRAALATGLPLAAAQVFGIPEAGWAGLTGLLVTLAYGGGSYRMRARRMGAVTVLGALVGGLAALGSGRPGTDAVLLLLGVTAASFARCYGEEAGALGEKLAVIFVASLGAPEGLEAAVLRFNALLLGGLWAMGLSLFVWPLRPYAPARAAIAHVYRGLAEAADELARRTLERAPLPVWEEALARPMSLRPRLEEARATLVATRRGLPSSSRRGEHLLVLLELCEPQLATLYALVQAMEVAAPAEGLQPLRERVAALCRAYAAMAQWVAGVLVGTPRVGRLLPALRRGEACRAESVAPAVRPRALALPVSVTELMARLREHAGAAHETAAALQQGAPVPERSCREVRPPQEGPRAWLQPVRDHLRPDSFILRHALRAGLTATLAFSLTHALGLSQAFWVVLAVLGILQPYSASTEERAVQRVVGTLLGASLAALIAGRLHSVVAALAIICLLTATSVSLLPLNFGVFQVLLTPDYMLLATLSSGDWSVAEERLLGVVLACALALAGAWLLWPSPERRRFPDAAAALLRADGDYLRQVAAGHSVTAPAVGAARRTFGLALLAAEASFQRLLAEYHGPPQQLEPCMALLTYSNRLAASATALGEQQAKAPHPRAVGQLATEASTTLERLADSLEARLPPPPLPPLPQPPGTADPVSCGLLERVPHQLGILQGAVERLSTGSVLR